MTAPTLDRTANPQDHLAAASALVPRIRELAPQIEAERRLLPELVEAFRSAGFFHLPFPEDRGGFGVDPVTAAKVVEEISLGDGSAGWCVMLGQQNAGFSGFMTADYAKEVWGDGRIACGTSRPTGRAVKQGDNFVVSGRWPFASGSSHADFFASECMLFDGDEPIRDAQGNHKSRMLMVPRSDVVIYDTWHTTGLRGTASNDFEVKGAVVPAGRGFQVLVDPPLSDWPLFKAPQLIFVNHGSHAVGVARGAIDSAKQIVATKVGYGTDKTLRFLPRIQAAIAEAYVTVEAAREYMYLQTQLLWDAATAAGDNEVDPFLRARTRLGATNAARSALRAVDLLHGQLGTAALMETTAFERQFRDIHMANAHVMISPFTLEAAGRVELGLEPEFPFF